jgi:hypothetical protein
MEHKIKEAMNENGGRTRESTDGDASSKYV